MRKRVSSRRQVMVAERPADGRGKGEHQTEDVRETLYAGVRISVVMTVERTT